MTEVIDGAAFYGAWPWWPLRRTLTDCGVRLLDGYGIGRAVISSLRAVFVDWEAGNEEVLAVAQREPRYVPVVVLVPQVGVDQEVVVTGYVSRGARAFRLYPQYHRFRLEENPLVDEVCELASAHDLPVWLSIRLLMDWSLPTVDTARVFGLARRFPETQFVISGVNYGELPEALVGMKQCRNTFLETSCLQVFGGLKRLADEVGADRLIFGTGLPLQYPLCNLEKVRASGLSLTDEDMVLGGNVARLLKL